MASTLRMARRFGRAASEVVVRRVLHGERRPGWSLRYELLAAGIRSTFLRPLRGERYEIGSGALGAQRALMDRYGKSRRVPSALAVQQTALGGVPAERVCVRTRAADGPTLLHLHGGGYTAGSPLSYRPLTFALATRTRAAVFALEYRLAPEHVCPAAIDDAVAAWRALVEDGRNPSDIVLTGDSAGGGLVLTTLVRLRDEGLSMPAGAVLFSPWTQLDGASLGDDSEVDYLSRKIIDANARTYAGEFALDDPRVSPAYAELAGLPPVFIVAGGAETLLEDSKVVAARLQEAGVAVALHVEEGEIHDFPLFSTWSPRARRVLDDVVEFVREVTR